MNSAMRPNFKEKFAEICTCGSCEQCTGSIEKRNADRKKRAIQT